jgi:hypothetical protein
MDRLFLPPPPPVVLSLADAAASSGSLSTAPAGRLALLESPRRHPGSLHPRREWLAVLGKVAQTRCRGGGVVLVLVMALVLVQVQVQVLVVVEQPATHNNG